MDQLDRLSIKELLDLNTAIQNEIALRLVRMSEENEQRTTFSWSLMSSEAKLARFDGSSRCLCYHRYSGETSEESELDQYWKIACYCIFRTEIWFRLIVFSFEMLNRVPIFPNALHISSIISRFSCKEILSGMSVGVLTKGSQTFSCQAVQTTLPGFGKWIRRHTPWAFFGVTVATTAPSILYDIIPLKISSAPPPETALAIFGSHRSLPV